VVLPVYDYGVFKENITEVISSRNLQPEPSTYLKVIQLHETMIVRHGVMTVGPTGGGKTTVLNVFITYYILTLT
jgi:dynein heavy chain